MEKRGGLETPTLEWLSLFCGILGPVIMEFEKEGIHKLAHRVLYIFGRCCFNSNNLHNKNCNYTNMKWSSCIIYITPK